MRNSKYFIGACTLMGGVLYKFGAPPASIALGIALAGLLHWRWRRRAS
jgi:hypothetical protein